jgi:hypothetical protein
VLAVEQVLRLKKALPFVIAGLSAVAAKLLAGDRGTILVGMLIASAALFAFQPRSVAKGGSHAEPR